MFQTFGMSLQYIIGFILYGNETFWIKLVILIIMQLLTLSCLIYLNYYIEPLDGKPILATGRKSTLRV